MIGKGDLEVEKGEGQGHVTDVEDSESNDSFSHILKDNRLFNITFLYINIINCVDFVKTSTYIA